MNPHPSAPKIKDALGSLILEALSDPDVIEIMINPDGKVWIDTLSSGMRQIGFEKPRNVENIIVTAAASLGIIAEDVKIVEGELAVSGERFEGVLPPVVPAPAISIRKRALKVFSLEDYRDRGALSEKHLRSIEDGIKKRKNFIVVGGTGSGKTTFFLPWFRLPTL